MPFYQNVFNQNYRIPLSSGDRPFDVPGNINSTQQMVGLIPGPYNLTGLTLLTINYSFDSGQHYGAISTDVTVDAVDLTAVTPYEIAANLNLDPTFSTLFSAGVRTTEAKFTQFTYVTITLLKPRPEARIYISNSGAESKIGFNSQAPVAELPTYFNRHTVTNGTEFPDSNGSFVLLDPNNAIDQAVITRAGLDYTTVQPDWQLLQGRSQNYNFQSYQIDGSGRVTQMLEYPAGGMVGDLAKVTNYVYTGANTTPSAITQVPYTLTEGDLITPP